MVHNRYNCCFLFWAILCPFTPLIAQKLKIKGNQTMKFGQLIEKYCEENEAGKLVPDYFLFFKKPFY